MHHRHHEEEAATQQFAAPSQPGSATIDTPPTATGGGQVPLPTSAMGSEPTSLPAVAQERIGRITRGEAAAASMSGYGEYVMLAETGFEPIGPVVGLTVMHLGRIQLAGIKTACELESYSNVISMGILTALARVQEEARLIGADGVILSSIDRHNFDGEEHQYAAKGTAVRFTPQPGALQTPQGRPFVCQLSAMTLYQMLRRGLAPVAIGYGVCVYHVPHRSMRQAVSQTFQNREIPIFTEGWYTGREIAISRLHSQLEGQGATLILDMNIQEEAEAFGEHTSEFKAVGMGWVHRPEVAQLVPSVDLVAPALIERGAIYPTSSV